MSKEIITQQIQEIVNKLMNSYVDQIASLLPQEEDESLNSIESRNLVARQILGTPDQFDESYREWKETLFDPDHKPFAEWLLAQYK